VLTHSQNGRCVFSSSQTADPSGFKTTFSALFEFGEEPLGPLLPLFSSAPGATAFWTGLGGGPCWLGWLSLTNVAVFFQEIAFPFCSLLCHVFAQRSFFFVPGNPSRAEPSFPFTLRVFFVEGVPVVLCCRGGKKVSRLHQVIFPDKSLGHP